MSGDQPSSGTAGPPRPLAPVEQYEATIADLRRELERSQAGNRVMITALRRIGELTGRVHGRARRIAGEALDEAHAAAQARPAERKP